MPQPFNDAVMTNSGASLLARAEAGETKITFTRMSTGNGEYTEEEKTVPALQEMIELKSLKNDYDISIVGIVNDTTVRVVALLANEDFTTSTSLVDEGYYINEIGLFAKDDEGNEVLYSIAVTSGEQGDYMPSFDGYNPAQITMEYFATVNNSADVTLEVSNSNLMLSTIYDPEGGGRQVAFEDDMVAQIQAAIAEAQATLDEAVAALELMMTNGTVTRLGTSTIGSNTKPIYLNSGTPTAFSNSVGGSNQPVYLSSGTITTCNSMVPQSGGVTMTGNLVGPTSTDYTTSRFRNIRFGTSKPSSLNNGEVYMVYE